MNIRITAGLLAIALPAQALAAQSAVMPVTYGGNKAKPVPQEPPVNPKDTPEEVAKDAARDLKDSRFYNKPGATRAQYDADWQRCRLIARGSNTPSGTAVHVYNPAIVSPLAAGVGAGIGGAIGAAIAEGVQRRANRRACLLINGWRMVEVPAAQQAKMEAMSDAERSAYFDTIVGAPNPDGFITERTSFTQKADRALMLDKPLSGPGTVFLGKKVDAAAPLKLEPNEGAIVLGFRRPGGGSEGRSGSVQFIRYDMEARDLSYQPRDWKKKGDKTTYAMMAQSKDRKAPYEVQVLKVTAGDYVINGTSVGPSAPLTTSNCFGAPVFNVGAGEVVYVGDFLPFMDHKLSDGESFHGLVHASHPEDARTTLAAKQPALAASLKPATLRNKATYACAAVTMDRWDIAGAEDLPEPIKAVEAAR